MRYYIQLVVYSSQVLTIGYLMIDHFSKCIYCGQSDQTAPLYQFIYKDKEYWICAQHFPILIHNPGLLADKLPGLELLEPSEGHS